MRIPFQTDWPLPENLRKRGGNFYESPNHAWLAFLGDSVSPQMSNDYSKIILVTNKLQPRLVFESEDLCVGNSGENVAYSADSRYLWFGGDALLNQASAPEKKYAYAFNFIRLGDSAIAFYCVASENCSLYVVAEAGPDRFELASSRYAQRQSISLPLAGTEINLNKLEWTPLSLPRQIVSKRCAEVCRLP